MIYRLDKAKRRITPCEETDFRALNLLERGDIEKWVEACPEVLGEELLILSTEYDKFDRTKERLDVLALDRDGNLVVIELKRDDSGKYVDLQAIKYAAYCSTLRLDDVVRLYADYAGGKRNRELNGEQARNEILRFITNDEFEEVSDRPRIILVSRQFRAEVTASVLWLRQFGLDISCVRLLPYDLGDGGIVFESNVLIPLPEARDFIIEGEKKEAGALTLTQSEYTEFYRELARRLSVDIPGSYPAPQPRAYYAIPTGIGSVHYEWGFHGRPRSSFGVELHFEKGSREANLSILAQVQNNVPQLEKALEEEVVVQKEWGSNWSRLYVSREEGQITEDLKEWAVSKMATMMKTLQPVFDGMA